MIVFTPRVSRSWVGSISSLFVAIILTLLAGALIFTVLGHAPLNALRVYFIDPVSTPTGVQELMVKASPLIMIAIGLSLCFRANVWNIGAEGQFVAGALAGGAVALQLDGATGGWILALVLLAGIAGGMLAALIVAILKIKFRTNEILTSLMLTYVFILLLDFMVRGPLRDPMGFGFPQTALFSPDATFPTLFIEALGFGRMHWGIVIAFVLAIFVWIMLSKTMSGYALKTIGASPRAGRFAGFSERKTIFYVLLVSGGLAGLAGVIEVTGPIGQLTPNISPGYGFTAIIVAFLGRLHPMGIVVAGLGIALSFIGGEMAQTMLKTPKVVTGVFQGILLFLLLLGETLTKYEIRWVRPKPVMKPTSTKPEVSPIGKAAS